MKELVISDDFIEKLDSYIQYLDDEKQEKYKIIKKDLAYRVSCNKTYELIKFLYEEVLSNEIYQWVDWQKTAIFYIYNIQEVETADIETIRKLINFILRKNRFAEGFFADMIEYKVLLKILRRLRTLIVK